MVVIKIDFVDFTLPLVIFINSIRQEFSFRFIRFGLGQKIMLMLFGIINYALISSASFAFDPCSQSSL